MSVNVLNVFNVTPEISHNRQVRQIADLKLKLFSRDDAEHFSPVGENP